MQNGSAATVESSMEIQFKKLKIELPYDPVLPLLGIYPTELKSGSQRDICTLMFTVLFIIAKMSKQTQCSSTDKWIKKKCYLYTMEYYPAFLKKGNFAICDNTDEL